MRPITIGAAALAATAVTLTTLAPATADAIGAKDAKDLDHGVDLRSVVVRHKPNNIVVTTTHVNLRRSYKSGSSGSVYLDTDPSTPGPEFVFAGGYYVGTGYNLLHTEGFPPSAWGMPVEGSYDMRTDYDTEQVRMRISREALGSPEQVRVAVKVGGTRTDGTSNGLVDWLGKPRSFTEWVAQ